MSRSYSLIGLHDRAFDYLNENVETNLGGDLIQEIYQEDDIFCCDNRPLYRYNLKNGGYVYEVSQEELWASGPHEFLCLYDGVDNLMYEWTEEEMYKEIGWDI